MGVAQVKADAECCGFRVSDDGKRSDAEEASQVTITLFGDPAQPRFAPLECCFGTRPIQAEKSPLTGRILDRRCWQPVRWLALATPGISSRRLLSSFERCHCKIFLSKSRVCAFNARSCSASAAIELRTISGTCIIFAGSRTTAGVG
jgi:hypothetical protein